MYRRILFDRKFSLKDRFKRLIAFYLLKRSAKIIWNVRFRKVFGLHHDFKIPAEKSVEKTHYIYWKPFQSHLNYSTLRVCKNISGISNPKYIPEEIFKADIEPTLNQTPSIEYLTYKSFYNYWFPGNIFPRDYFHNIEGMWLDHDLNPLRSEERRVGKECI